jgi:RNA polymerase sigma-32 factor
MAQTNDVGRDFAQAARSAPYLERDEERALAERWKGQRDAAALHRLAASHMRLVLAVASRYRRYGLALQDLVQEGNVGMLEAAARFDPAREVRFSTYASWWIRASIQDYVLRNWSIVRGGTSSGQKSLFFNLRRIRARLAQLDGGRDPRQAFADVARALGVSPGEVEMMNARLSGPDVSLNAPIPGSDGREDSERGDFLVDDAPLPDEVVGESIDGERRKSALRAALTTLDARELQIIRERRLKDEPATLDELGHALGVSKERVRQLETRALGKLKAAMIRQGVAPAGAAA